jgi:membrane associated rhomboid family serine protease
MLPIATYVLVAANVLLYGLELALGHGSAALLQQWGIVALDVRSALGGSDANPAAVVTLLTGAFLHASWVHLAKNMLYLWILGAVMEHQLGRTWYLGLYLASAVAAGLAQVIAAPTLAVPAVGASGAISGLVGAFLLAQPGAAVAVLMPRYFYGRRRDFTPAVLVVLWALTELLVGVLTVAGTSQAQPFGWWAHVGGFGAGAVLGGIAVRRATWPLRAIGSADVATYPLTAHEPRSVEGVTQRWQSQ